MLKIHKGLHKKKKKGKKSKKDEEDFDKAELEKYRREHQGEASQAPTQAAGSDEWKTFALLTSGVDDILKKTQDDLNRIKESSFFQRKAPGVVDTTKGPEELAAEQEILQREQEAQEERERQERLKPPPGVVDISDAEDEGDGDSEPEDIFDTAYVDVAVAGDLKLAYIPDSPVDELNPGEPDPFDTSIVDKVLPAEKQKKAVFNLGTAVDFLAGKSGHNPVLQLTDEEKKRHRRRIVKPVNLLLESFDAEEAGGVANEDPITQKTLLDDDPIFDAGVDIVPPVAEAIKPVLVSDKSTESFKEKEVESKVLELLGEFEPVTEPQIETNLSLVSEKTASDDELDDEFFALAAERKDRKLSGQEELGEDPFDTTFVANLIPGKLELKLIENDLLNAPIDDQDVVNNKKIIFDGNNLQFSNVKIKINANSVSSIEDVDNLDQLDVTRPLSFQHRDLLGGSTTDLSKIGHDPLEPKLNTDSEELTYSDPFDVSAVDKVIAPGKAELKFLEKELLESKAKPISQLDDDNFDPRAEESKESKSDIKRPDQLFNAPAKRASVPKIVAFKVESPSSKPDFLTAVDFEEDTKVNKPLTPYYPDPKDLENKRSFESDVVDPFDTSHVSHQPGKCEIKLLEEELKIHVASAPVTHSADDSFDPRAEQLRTTRGVPPTSLPIRPPPPCDILTADEHINVKLHTPVVPEKPYIAEEKSIVVRDPFDTSIAENILPGKAELKLLESELNAVEVPKLTKTYTDKEFNPRDKVAQVQPVTVNEIDIETNSIPVVDFNEVISETHSEIDYKPLTPIAAAEVDTFDDPFDTSSIVVGPSKTEIKLIESELFKN